MWNLSGLVTDMALRAARRASWARKHGAASAVGALAACLMIFALNSAPAAADSTHKFLFAVDLPAGTSPEPAAVDAEGNLFVFNEGPSTISKYRLDPESQTLIPVDFAALGSNTMDGHGFGKDCPATPDDCDRVPSNGFAPSPTANVANEPEPEVAIDNSDGPASGYIYVANPAGGPQGQGCSHEPPCNAGTLGGTEVFAPSGRYLGEIDKSIDGPTRSGAGGGRVTVSATGHIFISEPNSPTIIDEFVPIDGNPAHDVFRGQIYVASPRGVGDTLYSYFGNVGSWGKVAYSQYTTRHNARERADEVEFLPGEEIFEQGGADIEANGSFDTLNLDPVTHNVYISNGDRIREWTADNEPVGPLFGPPYAGDVRRLAFDHSSGSNQGTLYMRGAGNGGDQIAVFSPPIPLPDITYQPSPIGHTTAHIVANVSLNGGPEVTSCELQWGTTGAPSLPLYERKPIPCAPGTSFGNDQVVYADISGLSVEQDFHYRFVVKTANGEERGRNRNTRTAAVLNVTTDTPTDVTRTTAILHGSLNPDGLTTSYHYEYGATAAYGGRTPERTAPGGSAIAPLPDELLSNLQPGRLYHVRIVAANTLGSTVGPDVSLQIADKPSVFALRTHNLLETSVDLEGKIDSRGYETTYRFEYGQSIGYGQATPDVALPAGATPQDVAIHLSGLQADATYHFRVVATNQWGTAYGPDTTFSYFPPACPNSHVRQQTKAGYLPDCRAYELVSPEDTKGGFVIPGDSMSMWWYQNGEGAQLFNKQSAQNYGGLAVAPARFAFFGASSGMEDAYTPNDIGDLYIATRTLDGWVSKYVGVPGRGYFSGSHPQCSLTLDQCLEYPTLGSPGVELPRQGNIPFLTDTTSGGLISRLPSNQATGPDQGEFRGTGRASGDFSHYAFGSLERLFAVGGVTTEPGSVYDNNLETDTVQVVSRLSNGSPIPSEPGAHGDGSEPPEGNFAPIGKDFLEIPAVSRDGSHILMGARISPRCSGALSENDMPLYGCGEEKPQLHLYMRVNDAMTYDVSDGQTVALLGMTADGSTVYFSTPLQMIPADSDSSVDVYKWSEDTGELSVVSQGGGHGNTDECDATWTAACNVVPLSTCTAAWTFRCDYAHVPGEPHPYVSERPEIDTGMAAQDGAILFESPEQLDPTNPGVPGERNLYEFRDGVVRYVTTFDPGAETSRFNITPDGMHIAFLSDSHLTTYDNKSSSSVRCGAILNFSPGTVRTPCMEMYYYDVANEDLRCVSCNPTGAPPAGDVTASASGRFMTNDGRVFFNSSDALSPQDTNDLVDVYEYVDGRPQLISTGVGEKDLFGGYLPIGPLGVVYPAARVGLESVSADGTDVYFATFQTLVPQDRNGDFVKIYDARTSGGLAFNQPALPCPAADECHGDNSAAPEEPQIGTGAPLSIGSSSKGAKRPKKARKRARKRKHHRRATDRAMGISRGSRSA